jgi:hypothetical protein
VVLEGITYTEVVTAVAADELSRSH